jgi:putative spermidine/putrescine transport system substrate-binding protein
MTDDTSRRELLATGLRLGIAGATAGALWRPFAAAAQDVTVRATHFGGPYQVLRDVIAKPFEDAKLGRVTYDVETSPSAIAKMQTQRGEPPFDVVLMSRSFALRALNAGLLTKLAAAEIPESAQLLKGSLPPGGWGVPMILDTFDIMVDQKQVPEKLTSWLDLWRPDLKGKLVLPSAASPAAFHFIVCVIHAIGGDLSEAATNEAFNRFKDLKASARAFVADPVQATQLMERGDAAVAPQYGIRIANQARTLSNVAKVTPKEGVLAVPYDMCIPVGAKNVETVKKYINFALTEPVQKGLLQSLLATPARQGVAVPAELAPLVTTDVTKLWFIDEDQAAAKQRELIDRYTRTVQG